MPKRRKRQDWIHKLKTQNVTTVQEGTLSDGNSAQEMAQKIRSSAPNFQAAMAIVTLHENTMGKRLSQSHKRELEKTKHILRVMYKRKDRIEDYELPKKRGKLKWLKSRAAAYPVVWQDESGPGYGDMFVELLGKTPEQASGLTGVSNYHKRMMPHIEEWTEFLKKYFKTNDIEKIKKLLFEHWKNKEQEEVPVWDVVRYKPRVVKKKASLNSDLVFASEEQALSYLANLLNERVVVAVKKSQSIGEKKVRVADIDPDTTSRLNELVSTINKRQEQLDKIEALLKERVHRELEVKHMIEDNLKKAFSELEKLIESLKDAGQEATSVLVEIGNTLVTLEAYVSQRPQYKKTIEEFSKRLDESQRQALNLMIESSYEIKTKLGLTPKSEESSVAEEKIASCRAALVADQSKSWWSAVVSKLRGVYNMISGMLKSTDELKKLQRAIAAGEPV